MKYVIAALLLLLPLPLFAQQGPPPSPEAQALGGKLMEEINSNVSLRTQLIKSEAQIKMLTEENAKLKASVKAEASKPAEPSKK
jgi:hypothetical protein